MNLDFLQALLLLIADLLECDGEPEVVVSDAFNNNPRVLRVLAFRSLVKQAAKQGVPLGQRRRVARDARPAFLEFARLQAIELLELDPLELEVVE